MVYVSGYMLTHRWIDYDYHPLPKVICDNITICHFILEFLLVFWSLQQAFLKSAARHDPSVDRSRYLAPDLYTYSLFEPSDNAQESITVHHIISTLTNITIYRQDSFSICWYTTVYNGLGTLHISCVLNSWMFISVTGSVWWYVCRL